MPVDAVTRVMQVVRARDETTRQVSRDAGRSLRRLARLKATSPAPARAVHDTVAVPAPPAW